VLSSPPEAAAVDSKSAIAASALKVATINPRVLSATFV
jgi:hypothetical protein